MLAVGVKVRVLAPFTEQFPDVYVIEGQSEHGWIVAGIDFAPIYLKAV